MTNVTPTRPLNDSGSDSTAVSPGSGPSNVSSRCVEGAVFIVAVVLFDFFSFAYEMAPIGVTPWTPSTGLAVAQLLRRGPAFAPFFVLASIASDMVVGNQRIPLMWSVLLALVKVTGYTGAAWILKQRLGDAISFRRLHHLAWFAGANLTAGIGVAATCATIFAAAGMIDTQSIADAAVRYWIGDALGILIFTPLLLRFRVLATQLVAATRWPIAIEAGAQLIAVLISLWIVFGLDLSLNLNDEFPALYPLFLPIIWIAARHGVEGVTVALAIVQVMLILALESQGYAVGRVISFQFFLLSIAMGGLFLGAVVSERRDAADMLVEREARLDAIYRAAPDGILVVDQHGRITSANPAAAALLQCSRDAIIDRPIIDFLVDLRAVEQQEPQAAVIRRDDGTVLPIEISIGAVMAGDDQSLTLILRDASQRKAAEAQLHQHQMELAQASRATLAGEMVTAVTHEVGQPIAAAATYLGTARLLLEQPTLNRTKILDVVDKASVQARRSAEILSRLRELLQHGRVDAEAIDIDSIVRSAVGLARADIEASHVRVTLDLAPQLPLVLAERIHIEQVLVNLLRNAVEAMVDQPAGSRLLRVATRLAREFVEVEVSDSGPGPDPQIADRLFQPFVGTKDRGMGLGLAISRSIVGAHGGALRYEPVFSGGARFLFTLPIGPNHGG